MRDYLIEHLSYKANSEHLFGLKKRMLDEDLRHYLIGLATALTFCNRKSQIDYTAREYVERIKEARDLSGILTQTIKDLNGVLGPERVVQDLEARLKEVKDKTKIDEKSALKKISDDKVYLTNFGERVETRLQGKSYEAYYFIYEEKMKRALESIKKQTLSEEDREKEKIRAMDYRQAKIFDKEGEIIRGAMIFEVKKI